MFSLQICLRISLGLWWQNKNIRVKISESLDFIPRVIRISIIRRFFSLLIQIEYKPNLRKAVYDFPENCKRISWFSKWSFLALYLLVCLRRDVKTNPTNESSTAWTIWQLLIWLWTVIMNHKVFVGKLSVRQNVFWQTAVRQKVFWQSVRVPVFTKRFGKLHDLTTM